MSADVTGVITWLKNWFYDEDEIDAKEQALQTTIGNKVDKVTGKGLSTNDYTTTEKNKLANIEAQANKTVVDSSMSSTSTNPVQNKVIWNKCVFQEDYELDTVSDNIPLRISQASGQYLSGMGFTNDDTIEEVLEEFAGRIVEMQNQWNTVYPIGAIYMSVNSTSPSTLFGGTWQRLEDTFLYATSDTADTFNTPPTDGTRGKATHTLTVDEMPSHSHNNTNGSSSFLGYITSTSDTTSGFTTGNLWRDVGKAVTRIQNTGGGQAHNNMPPYMKVYMWKRTA